MSRPSRTVTCGNCTIGHGVAVGRRHPDNCPICGHPHRFTAEQRADLDRRTGWTGVPRDGDGR